MFMYIFEMASMTYAYLSRAGSRPYSMVSLCVTWARVARPGQSLTSLAFLRSNSTAPSSSARKPKLSVSASSTFSVQPVSSLKKPVSGWEKSDLCSRRPVLCCKEPVGISREQLSDWKKSILSLKFRSKVTSKWLILKCMHIQCTSRNI